MKHLEHLLKQITFNGVCDFVATLTAFILPVLLIVGIWLGFEPIRKYLLTDIVLLVSAVVFYLIQKK